MQDSDVIYSCNSAQGLLPIKDVPHLTFFSCSRKPPSQHPRRVERSRRRHSPLGEETAFELAFSGNDETYRHSLGLPADYDPSVPTPLLLYFHGWGGNFRECGNQGICDPTDFGYRLRLLRYDPRRTSIGFWHDNCGPTSPRNYVADVLRASGLDFRSYGACRRTVAEEWIRRGEAASGGTFRATSALDPDTGRRACLSHRIMVVAQHTACADYVTNLCLEVLHGLIRLNHSASNWLWKIISFPAVVGRHGTAARAWRVTMGSSVDRHPLPRLRRILFGFTLRP